MCWKYQDTRESVIAVRHHGRSPFGMNSFLLDRQQDRDPGKRRQCRHVVREARHAFGEVSPHLRVELLDRASQIGDLSVQHRGHRRRLGRGQASGRRRRGLRGG